MIITFLCAEQAISQNRNLSLSYQTIADSLKKGSRAVVRYDHTSVTLKELNLYLTEYEYAITVLTKKGDGYLDFNAFYKEGSETISDIQIEYYDGSGNKIKEIKKKEVEDYSALSGFELIGDFRRKHYSFETNNYPITLAVSYRKESENTMHLTGWQPIAGYRLSIESSDFKVKNETSIPIKQHKLNFSKYHSINKVENGYTMTNQKGIVQEKFSGSNYDVFPILYTRPQAYAYEGIKGSHESWDEFGEWMYSKFLKDKSDLKKSEVKQELDKILNGIDDPKEIVSEIYKFIQSQTRYIYIGLDEGGYAPLSAQKVHEVKYGDCKALSFYMKALLDVYDIPSNYVIVHANSTIPTDLFEGFPDTRPSNHVILNVPFENDTLWIDCTSNDNPVNFLGSFTDDRMALELRPDGASVIRTPIFSEKDNKRMINSNVKVFETGDVKVQAKVESRGLLIERGLHLKKLDQEDYEKYLKSDWLEDFDRVKLENFKTTFSKKERVITENYSFSATGHGRSASSYILLPYKLFSFPIPKLKKDSNREQKIVFSRGYSYEFSDEYEFPQGYRFSVPDEISKISEFGIYNRKVEKIENQSYRIIREFVLFKGEYSQSQYNAIKKFFDSILKLELDKLSMQNKS